MTRPSNSSAYYTTMAWYHHSGRVNLHLCGHCSKAAFQQAEIEWADMDKGPRLPMFLTTSRPICCTSQLQRWYSSGLQRRRCLSKLATEIGMRCLLSRARGSTSSALAGVEAR